MTVCYRHSLTTSVLFHEPEHWPGRQCSQLQYQWTEDLQLVADEQARTRLKPFLRATTEYFALFSYSLGVRPSVRLSVCVFVTLCSLSKTVRARITKSLPQGLVCMTKFCTS